MASICEIVEESTNACLKWVEYTPVLDQIAITKDDALLILTPIASIYVLLIGWSFIMLIYHQSK
jgi:hypothetical protein